VWSDVEFDEALVEPVCQAGLLGVTDPRHGRALVLFSNPASTERVRMTVRLSADGCRTWTAGLDLWEGPSAYSDLCVAPDGTICCPYECGAESAYETITLARFGLECLAGGQAQ
jgi:sialidase-1